MKKTLMRNTQIHKDKVEKVPNREPFYFIRWTIVAQIIIFAIMFSFGAIFNLIPGKVKFRIKYSIEKVFINDKIDNDGNSIIYCLESLRENDYLNENNKVFIENYLIKEIEENKEFIDLNKVAKRLETLDVHYNKKYLINELNNEIILNNPKEYNLHVAGRYNSLFNEINIYEQIDFEKISKNYNDIEFGFAEASKTAYFHELNHVLTNGTVESFVSMVNIKKSNILSELINELFSREYYYIETSEGYDEQMKYIYVIAEIISEDVLRKYKFNDNESILISGLLDIDGDIDKAFELISLIKDIQIKEDKNDDSFTKLHDLFEYYYEKKSGKKLVDNLNILAYLYDSKVLTDTEKEIFENYVGIKNVVKQIDVIPRGYFSKDYIKEYPNTVVKINNAYFKILK